EQLLRPAGRAAPADPADHGPLPLQRGVRRDPARVHDRHRRELPAVLGQHPAVGAGATPVRVRRDLQPVRRGGRARRWVRPAGGRPRGGGRAVRDRRHRTADHRGRGALAGRGRLRLPPARLRLAPAPDGGGGADLPLAAQDLRARRGARRPRAVRHERAGRGACRDARHRRGVEHDALRRHGRPASRHARQHRQLRARRHHPVPRDPRDGARPLRPRGQGDVPPQRGLGRGRGRRLHVAARVLSPGLLQQRTRSVPLPPLQGRQPARAARRRARL
ncbi:MAG: Ureidoglycine aminohydrolase, partial [uncultured Nocardioides sp.]